MKQYIDLLHYHFITYLKTNKYIMPVLVWIGWLVSFYMIKPVEIVSSFMVTAVVSNFIMVWIGISYFDSVDIVSDRYCS